MNTQTREDDGLTIWRKNILALLMPLSIKTLYVNYHGADGFREIEWQAEPDLAKLGDGPCIVDRGDGSKESYLEVWDAVREFAWNVIDTLHPNFESDLGGNGTLTFDCEEQSAKLDHAERYISENTTTTHI